MTSEMESLSEGAQKGANSERSDGALKCKASKTGVGEVQQQRSTTK
jgi:hypothetical protein